MPPLDYEGPADRPSRLGRLALPLVIAITLLPILLPLGWLTVAFVQTRLDSRKFHAAFPESQIVGQSVNQVVTRFGRPNRLARNADGTIVLTYTSPATWEYCGIEFQNDKATRVRFWGK